MKKRQIAEIYFVCFNLCRIFAALNNMFMNVFGAQYHHYYNGQ
jgi:hypothetical protein